MPNIKKILLSMSIVAATTTGAMADTFQLYGEAGGWKVFIDTDKKSCLIENIDDAENVVQIGLTTDRGVAYVGVFTKSETAIKKDDKEAVAILLDDQMYIGESTGMRGNITKGYSGGYVLTDDPQFVEDIARKYTMTVFPESEFAFIVDLTGTYDAIELARECNSKQ